MGKINSTIADSDHAPVIRKSTFRFYEELNDHLPDKWKKKNIVYEFRGTPSVRNAIHAIGVPHIEVDLVLVDGESVNFDFRIKGGEHVSVYPVFEAFDISPVVRLRPVPLRENRFIVDVNLGKLAYKLRLLGFDTLFRNDLEDDEIIITALNENRIILTRDRGILKQNVVTHGYWLRNDDPAKQLAEVIERLQLYNSLNPFTRCSVCNGNLRIKNKAELTEKLPPDTLQYYNEFWECTACGKIYWKGSHFKHILKWVDNLKGGHND